jgi:hypothetical protein
MREGDLFYATEDGIAVLGGEVSSLPSPGHQLVAFWADRVSGAGRLLMMLADDYPRWTTREFLAEQAQLAASGGTFSTYLSRLRAPGLIEEDGPRLRLAPALME